MTRTVSVIIYLLAVVVLTASVWAYSARQSVSALVPRGQSDLALASDRLVSGISSYRLQTVSLASDLRLQSPDTPTLELAAILRRGADLSGALDFVLLDTDRQPLASAFNSSVRGWWDEPMVDHALSGTLGTHLMYSSDFGRRTFLIAAPIFDPDGPVTRVLVTLVDLERIEADFRGDNPAVFVTDQTGVIYFSNRSELVLRNSRLEPGPPEAQGFLDYTSNTFSGTEIWTISASRYLPRRAIHVVQDLPVIGMQAEALVDVAPALATAWLQAAVVGFAFLLFGAVFFLVTRQRHMLAVANEALEGEVRARTRELSDANMALRAEVNERIEAETALKKAQRDLIQAEKLSALGKMSAGISHELNQPLMAIQQYSENAGRFLQLKDTENAHNNLSEIQKLSQRMARIIRNLRAFARNEREPMARVDVLDVINAALVLTRTRIDQTQTELITDLPPAPVYVNAGEVRLSQVIVNLISNALDAMEESKERKLSITVSVKTQVEIHVTDTGPGIDDPEKMFDPFYTTKSVDKGEGLGLGLSISYGLVQSFGGDIKGKNSPAGAHMVVTLDKRNNDEH